METTTYYQKHWCWLQAGWWKQELEASTKIGHTVDYSNLTLCWVYVPIKAFGHINLMYFEFLVETGNVNVKSKVSCKWWETSCHGYCSTEHPSRYLWCWSTNDCNRGVWWFCANSTTVDVSFTCFVGSLGKFRVDWAHAVSLMTKGTHQSLEKDQCCEIQTQSIERKHRFLGVSFHFVVGALCSKLSKLNCAMNIVRKLSNSIWPMALNLHQFQSVHLVKRITHGLHHHNEVGWLGRAAMLMYFPALQGTGKKINQLLDKFLCLNS